MLQLNSYHSKPCMEGLRLLCYCSEHKTTNGSMEQQLMKRDMVIMTLKHHLVIAQNTIKKSEDRARREQTFAIEICFTQKYDPIGSSPKQSAVARS